MEEELEDQWQWDESDASLSALKPDKDVFWQRDDSDLREDSWDSDSWSDSESVCPLCQQLRRGYLKQTPYATCWRCWTLASHRCWWELAKTLPEPAVALAHQFLFGEWSVIDLGFQAEDPVMFDLQMLEQTPPTENLVQIISKLMLLRPVRFFSLWPSSLLYQIIKKWPSFQRSDWRELIIWEGGALDLEAPSLLTTLGVRGLASLTQQVKQASAAQQVPISRWIQGKASLVGETPWPARFPALQTVVDQFHGLFLSWTHGRVFRIGTLPVERQRTSIWFTSAASGLAQTSPSVFCFSADSLARQLQERFPL
jgi:hypothetical protein